MPRVTQLVRGRAELEPMDFESSKPLKEKKVRNTFEIIRWDPHPSSGTDDKKGRP